MKGLTPTDCLRYINRNLGAAMQVTVGNHNKNTDGTYQTTGYNGNAPTATFT